MSIELEVNTRHGDEDRAADATGKAALRQQVARELYAQRCAPAQALARRELIFQLGGGGKGTLPKDLVSGNYFAEQRNFNLRLQANNVNFDQYLKVRGQTVEQFRTELHAQAEQKLRGNPSFIFTLIQKFNKPDAEPIYPDHDIIVISDEAHRTQNGVFAENLLHLLPTANRIGFTGTPLLRDDNITARTFGGYVSIYDFKRAVDDKATVPLYYENRGERLKELKNPEFNEEIAAVLEQAGEIDASQQAKLEREFAKEVHLLTAPKRLRIVAQDFVRHYSDLWTSGKAMVVCYNKVTCVRMYNYVQEYWLKEIVALEKQIS